MATKKRRRTTRKKKDQTAYPLASGLSKEWDDSIGLGSLVTLRIEKEVPHIYEVLERYDRVVMDHDLFNSPLLLSRGFKSGDELAPILTIKRVYFAPEYDPVPLRSTWKKKVAASDTDKVTEERVISWISKYNAILERCKNND